jgi:uncharacterized protein (TIGR03437 family)
MLRAIWLAFVLIGSVRADSSAIRQAPSYSGASVVNAASNEANAYAPNAFVTVYGKNLAWTTRSLSGQDIRGDRLPTILPNTGVRVWVGAVPAFIYYVSPDQINALLPTNLRPGKSEIRVQVDALYGPAIPIVITATAPALFQLDATTAIAAHADGSLVTYESPAHPGEVIVLYATGLGTTIPDLEYGEIPQSAAPIADMAGFGIELDGVPVDPKHILYAGVAPGFGGLYQINLRLPESLSEDPEVRITAGGASSPPGIRIPARKSGPAE